MPYTGGTTTVPTDAVAGSGNPPSQFNQLKSDVVDMRGGILPLTSETEAVVVHNGTTTGPVRPSGYVRVRWVNPPGTAYSRPTNMVAGDIWEHDA